MRSDALAQRIVVQVRVTLGSDCLRMSQQFADYWQPEASTRAYRRMGE